MQLSVEVQSWSWVWSYLGGALTSEWVLRPLHGVTGRGVAAWPHAGPAVSIFGGQATTLPIAGLLSAVERQRQVVARSCIRRWRVLWSPRPSATVLTPRGACDLGRAAEQYEEPSNHGFTLSLDPVIQASSDDSLRGGSSMLENPMCYFPPNQPCK